MIPDFSLLKEFGLAIFLIVFIVSLFTYLLKTINFRWRVKNE